MDTLSHAQDVTLSTRMFAPHEEARRHSAKRYYGPDGEVMAETQLVRVSRDKGGNATMDELEPDGRGWIDRDPSCGYLWKRRHQ